MWDCSDKSDMRRSEVIMGLRVRNFYTNSEKTAAGRIDTL